MKYLSFIVVYLIFGFIITVIINPSILNPILYKADCSYQVPQGYKIAYSEEDKLYVVKVLEHEDYYLYNGFSKPKTMFSSIAKPALFKDSCGAKGFLKAYIQDKQPKIQGYK